MQKICNNMGPDLDHQASSGGGDGGGGEANSQAKLLLIHSLKRSI